VLGGTRPAVLRRVVVLRARVTVRATPLVPARAAASTTAAIVGHRGGLALAVLINCALTTACVHTTYVAGVAHVTVRTTVLTGTGFAVRARPRPVAIAIARLAIRGDLHRKRVVVAASEGACLAVGPHLAVARGAVRAGLSLVSYLAMADALRVSSVALHLVRCVVAVLHSTLLTTRIVIYVARVAAAAVTTHESRLA